MLSSLEGTGAQWVRVESTLWWHGVLGGPGTKIQSNLCTCGEATVEPSGLA